MMRPPPCAAITSTTVDSVTGRWNASMNAARERPDDERRAEGGLEQRLRDERRSQRGPARARDVPVDERELDDVAAARGDHGVEAGTGEVGLDDVAAREVLRLRIGRAQDRVP